MAVFTEESGDVKGEERALTGDSDVANGEGSWGILDSAVGTATEGTEARLVGKGKGKLNGEGDRRRGRWRLLPEGRLICW